MRVVPVASPGHPCIRRRQSCLRRREDLPLGVSGPTVSPPASWAGNHGAAHLFLKQPMELIPAILDPQPIGGIHHPDEGVRLLEVVPPVRTQRLLPTNVPCEFEHGTPY